MERYFSVYENNFDPTPKEVYLYKGEGGFFKFDGKKWVDQPSNDYFDLYSAPFGMYYYDTTELTKSEVEKRIGKENLAKICDDISNNF